MVLLAADLPCFDVFGRMRRVAQRIERRGNLRELYRLGVPADFDNRPAHVQPRFDHAGSDLRQFLDQPDAGRAVDALEVELDRLRAVSQAAIIEVAEDLVVELHITPIGRPRGPGFFLRGLAEAIEPFQAAPVNDLVDRAATAAAKLQFFARLNETRRNRQAAVGTGDVRSRYAGRSFQAR